MIPKTRPSVAALIAVVALTTAACENGLFQEPSDASASLVLDLEVSSIAGGPASAFDAADRVRVLALEGQRVRFDRTIPIQAQGRNLQLTIDIPRRRLRESLTLQVEVRRGDAPLFRGSVPLQIRLGRSPSASLSLDPIGHALLLPASYPLITAYGDSVIADGTVVFATGDTLAVGPVLWTSLDPNIVAVTGGLPVARADGDARLVGRSGTLQDTLVVRVLASVQTLVLQPDAGPLSVGGTRQFSVLLFDRRGNPIVTTRPVAWSTTEPSIITMTQQGLATGVGIGSSQLGASSGAGSASLLVQSQPGAPVVTTDSVIHITLTSAEFRETVRPNGAPTEAWFDYARDSTFANALTTPTVVLPASLTPTQLAAPVFGLSAGTAYHVRARARNAMGTSTGRVIIFVSNTGQFAVQTGPAIDITNTGATLLGTVFPAGAPATAWFEWGTSPTLSGAASTPVTTITASSSSAPFLSVLSGLAPNTTYYYRAVATSGSATAQGAILSFRTQSGPGTGAPFVSTEPAGPLFTDSARLNALVNPNGLAASAWFEWGTDPSLATFVTTAAQSAGAGTSSAGFAQSVSGLTGNTTYYFRAAASNSNGTSKGVIRAFTTPPNPLVTPPAATTSPAAPIFADSARLQGSVNPNGASTSVWFEWGTDPALIAFSSTPVQNAGAGMAGVSQSWVVKPLASTTTYYFRIVASNAGGTTKGTILSFVTLSGGSGTLPTVTTQPAVPVYADSAYLRGTVNPQSSPTSVWFLWGTSPGSLTNTTPAGAVGSGSSTIPFSALLDVLAPSTTYYFRAVASNSAGTALGSVLSFTTLTTLPGPPSATTNPAQPIQADSAVLNGTVNPNGPLGNAWFEWGTDPSLGTFATTPAHAVGPGSSPIAVGTVVQSLTPGTTYYFRVVISTAGGTAVGGILSFTAATTPGGGLPSATTLPATDMTQTTVTLNGNADPNGSPAAFWFEWGTDPTLGTFSTTPAQFVGSGGATPVSTGLANLTNDTRYYFRLVVFNGNGTAKGAILTFRTREGV